MGILSFQCLSHCWHLHQDFRNPSQRSKMTLPQRSARHSLPFDRGIGHVALLLESARFELVESWLCVASGTSTNLLSCHACGISTGFFRYLPLHVHGDIDTLSMTALVLPPWFLWTIWTGRICLCIGGGA